MIKKLLFLFLLIAIDSCTVERMGVIPTLYQNDSGHWIELIPYRESLKLTQLYVLVEVGETKEISKSSNEPSYITQLMAVDSVVVVFDGKQRSSHYGNSGGKNTTAIKYEEVRNIINEKNYLKEQTCHNKHTSELTFTFSFNEQDYLNAK